MHIALSQISIPMSESSFRVIVSVFLLISNLKLKKIQCANPWCMKSAKKLNKLNDFAPFHCFLVLLSNYNEGRLLDTGGV